MSRPESMMQKTYCPHGFPRLMCNTCARSNTCVHGKPPQDCLLCFMYGSRGPYGLGADTAVTQCKDVSFKV